MRNKDAVQKHLPGNRFDVPHHKVKVIGNITLKNQVLHLSSTYAATQYNAHYIFSRIYIDITGDMAIRAIGDSPWGDPE